jgi:hypothetical protein
VAGQRVEFLAVHLRALGVVDYLPVLPEAHVLDGVQLAPLRIFHHRVIEFPAHDKVDGLGRAQALFRLSLHVRTDETDLQVRPGILHLLGEPHVVKKANR